MSLPFAYHVLTISLPLASRFPSSASCAEFAASCEGRCFGVAGVCIPSSLSFGHHVSLAATCAQIVSKMRGGPLCDCWCVHTVCPPLAYNVFVSLPCVYHVLSICFMCRFVEQVVKKTVAELLVCALHILTNRVFACPSTIFTICLPFPDLLLHVHN